LQLRNTHQKSITFQILITHTKLISFQIIVDIALLIYHVHNFVSNRIGRIAKLSIMILITVRVIAYNSV